MKTAFAGARDPRGHAVPGCRVGADADEPGDPGERVDPRDAPDLRARRRHRPAPEHRVGDRDRHRGRPDGGEPDGRQQLAPGGVYWMPGLTPTTSATRAGARPSSGTSSSSAATERGSALRPDISPRRDGRRDRARGEMPGVKVEPDSALLGQLVHLLEVGVKHGHREPGRLERGLHHRPESARPGGAGRGGGGG